MTKTCVICGKPFEAYGSHKTCSCECHNQLRAQWKREYRAQQQAQRQTTAKTAPPADTSPKIKICSICGKTFRVHGNHHTCSKECSAIRQAKQTRQSQCRAAEIKQQIKNSWLTIPDAPNYEINAQLQCRNKKTGRLLKQQHIINGLNNPNTIFFGLYRNGKFIFRAAKTFLRQATDAVMQHNFVPIPSLQNLYEINKRGVCRHVKMLIPLKAVKGSFRFAINGEHISRSRTNLLFEVFGTTAPNSHLRLPVILSNGNRQLFFDTKKEAANFLAPILGISAGTIQCYYLCHYVKDIHGWKVTYSNEDSKDYTRPLNLEAHRQKRVYDQTVKQQAQENTRDPN